MKKPEEILHLKICDYLRKNYPDVIFRTDFSSGMKMTPGQAAKHKKFQSSRAYPDLFIAEPKRGKSGLFLEIKAVNIYRKDGVTLLKNEHVEEQAEMLEKLRNKGYSAGFACGFNEAIMMVQAYLGEPKEKKVEF